MTILFETVFRMSLTASAVIAAVLLIRLALRKAPKKISYALWSVVGFRLLCPVSFRSAFSLFRFVPEKVTQIAPVEPAFSAPALPAAEPVMAGTPIRYSAAADLATVARPAVIPGIGQTADLAETAAEQAVETAAGTDPLALFLTIGAAVWILGAVLLTVYAVYSCAAMSRRLRTATRLEGNVFQSDAIRSPFLFGIFAPRIYVPYGLEPDTLQFVLCHERVHLRRRDDLWKTLGFAALALHWFNPLVWLSFRLMTRDMEMSCDERVLADGGASARSYSLSLLSFAERRRFPSPVPLAFGESDVKARIRNILDWKRPRLWITVAAVLLALVTAVSCASDPAKTVPESEKPEEAQIETYDDSPAATAEAPVPVVHTALKLPETDPDLAALCADPCGDLEALRVTLQNKFREQHLPFEQATAGKLYQRVAELLKVYETVSDTNYSGHSHSGSYSQKTSADYRTDTGRVDWKFGRSNLVTLFLPPLWSLCAELDPSISDPDSAAPVYTLHFFSEIYTVSPSSEYFSLVLSPLTDPDEIPADLPEAALWICTLSTKRDGLFRLSMLPGNAEGEQAYGIDADRLSADIPAILSTLDFPYSSTEILAQNDAVFTRSEEEIRAYAALCRESDEKRIGLWDEKRAELEAVCRAFLDTPRDEAIPESVKDLLADPWYGSSFYFDSTYASMQNSSQAENRIVVDEILDGGTRLTGWIEPDGGTDSLMAQEEAIRAEEEKIRAMQAEIRLISERKAELADEAAAVHGALARIAETRDWMNEENGTSDESAVLNEVLNRIENERSALTAESQAVKKVLAASQQKLEAEKVKNRVEAERRAQEEENLRREQELMERLLEQQKIIEEARRAQEEEKAAADNRFISEPADGVSWP